MLTISPFSTVTARLQESGQSRGHAVSTVERPQSSVSSDFAIYPVYEPRLITARTGRPGVTAGSPFSSSFYDVPCPSGVDSSGGARSGNRSPRTSSTAFFNAPTYGIELSAVSRLPPRTPFRRIANPTVTTATAAPNYGTDTASLLVIRAAPH